MTFNEYQVLAERTMNKDLSKSDMNNHALFGLCSEVGEVQGLFQKVYQGHTMDETHFKKEVSDCLWFMAEICTANGWQFDEIARMNIEKLKARYPDGFTAEKSLHRVEGDI